MEKDLLKKCRTYESSEASKIPSNERPPLHLTPQIGWMNDPNGFIYYKNAYHLFYQYNPYDTVWGPMHWGNAVSKDLIHWEQLPAALAPDSESDKEGCFSGSAIETKDGKLALIYTGVKKTAEDKIAQIQCLAEGDGLDFEKYSGNPIIGSDQLPAGCQECDFRDPKVIEAEDGSYVLYAVNRTSGGKGQILVYKSENLKDWAFCSVLLQNDCNLGEMWECPDSFTLQGKDILIFSVQDVRQSDRFDSGNIAVYAIGKYDYQSHQFTKEQIFQIDRGLDFYAPQTIESKDGRRIMIAWLQNWDICNYKANNARWYGQMSIPRELWLKDGLLYQKPVRELENYRTNKTEHKGIKVEDRKISLRGVEGSCLDLTIRVDGTRADLFSIQLFERDESYARVYYDFNLQRAGIDRSRTGSPRAFLHERSCEYVPASGSTIKIRIIVDRNSVEAFFGEGELTLSMSIYEEQPHSGISFYCKGTGIVDVECYSLQ